MRLFVSVDIPPFEVPGLGGGHGAGQAPLHLTLKFLGDVDDGRVGEVGRELERGVHGASSFPVTVEGLGAFPSSSRPRVLWAGISRGADELEDLARRTEGALAPLGFPGEGRPFVAHVTLRRFRPGASTGDARALLERHARTVFAQGVVRHVDLQQSVLAPSGAIHTKLLSVPLGPPLS